MENFYRFRNMSFDKQLFAVILGLFIIVVLLSQQFSSLNVLSEPFLIILGCLFVWINVSHENSIRRLIGICIITFLVSLTLLKWVPFSHAIAEFIIYPMGALFLLEFTRVAKKDKKASFLWLLIVPLILGSAAEQFLSNTEWWIPFLSFPIAWLYMALYANATTFKSTMKYVGAFLTVLLVGIYISVDILALDFVTQMFENEEITQVFAHKDTVPFVHLAVTAFFIPFLVTCLICYLIANNREKKLIDA
ncbi:hypothetical protein [Metabacillus indicus]|uniref:hypothetical protein n=1 Tax=Metabacillus indicus TaxID=246786 RepID=UPI0004933341|nr:hypothetical protein [Metabacillus indicus]KEZ48805.1 hypothetical protein AZ46_0218155 [Metabacillus indicus LMG 22858]